MMKKGGAVAAGVNDDAAAVVVEAGEKPFHSLGISRALVNQCKRMRFEMARPVQVACIPPILRGEDVYAAAKTGSGKTAAFALPIIHRLIEDPYGIFAVVLTPTRELALQIADQFKAFGSVANIRHCVVIGGIDILSEQNELARLPHVVIATPGRLAAHIRGAGAIDLSRVDVLVLDEADRLMTNASMQPDLETIYNAIPPERQNLLFSATLLDEPAGLIATQLHHPMFRYKAPSEEATVSTLTQEYLLVNQHARSAYLIALLEKLDEDESKIIFTATREVCEILSHMLRSFNHKCVALHGNMSQRSRMDSLDKFRTGYIPVLIATDVASRGLDIPHVRYVINYTLPLAVDDYIHRVGRTARAGRGGVAYSLIDPRDIEVLHAIEEDINVKIGTTDIVEDDDVVKYLDQTNLAFREAKIDLESSKFREREERNKKGKAKPAHVVAREKRTKDALHKSKSKKARGPGRTDKKVTAKKPKKMKKKKIT